MDADPLPCPPLSLPSLQLLLQSVSSVPFPALLCFSPLKQAERFWEAMWDSHIAQRKKENQLQKLEGTKCTRISTVGGDASHGSRKVVAPMTWTLRGSRGSCDTMVSSPTGQDAVMGVLGLEAQVLGPCLVPKSLLPSMSARVALSSGINGYSSTREATRPSTRLQNYSLATALVDIDGFTGGRRWKLDDRRHRGTRTRRPPDSDRTNLEIYQGWQN